MMLVTTADVVARPTPSESSFASNPRMQLIAVMMNAKTMLFVRLSTKKRGGTQ